MTKMSFGVACIGIILLAVTLQETNFYPVIIVSLAIFGFFGLGSFPLTLELAVEETFPADPVISEAFIHMSGQAQAILFILLGNVMHWDPDREMMNTQVCMDQSLALDSQGAVKPWDFTPYYYFLMAIGFLGAR